MTVNIKDPVAPDPHGVGSNAKPIRLNERLSGPAPIIHLPSPRPKARLRLICIPYAGGNASAFCRWDADLPDEVELVIVELPGHGRLLREPLYRDIYPLIDHLTSLLTQWSDKPYIIFGHSLGGLLAYVTSLAMEERRKPLPLHLVLSGCRPPHVPSKLEAICRLSDDDFHAHLRERRSIPETLLANSAFMALIMPIIRADFELIVSYRHSDDCYRVGIPVSLFMGTRDPIAPTREMERWVDLIGATMDTYIFEGQHFFIDERRDMITATLSEICLGVLDEVPKGPFS